MGERVESPSPTLPKGREFVLAVFEEVVFTLFLLKKAGMGPLFCLFPFPLRRLGCGLWLMVRTLGNSVGVAISQPRVEVRSASTLGIYIIRCSYSVRVAISRRRYTQSDIIPLHIPTHHLATSNAYG